MKKALVDLHNTLKDGRPAVNMHSVSKFRPRPRRFSSDHSEGLHVRTDAVDWDKHSAAHVEPGSGGMEGRANRTLWMCPTVFSTHPAETVLLRGHCPEVIKHWGE